MKCFASTAFISAAVAMLSAHALAEQSTKSENTHLAALRASNTDGYNQVSEDGIEAYTKLLELQTALQMDLGDYAQFRLYVDGNGGEWLLVRQHRNSGAWFHFASGEYYREWFADHGIPATQRQYGHNYCPNETNMSFQDAVRPLFQGFQLGRPNQSQYIILSGNGYNLGDINTNFDHGFLRYIPRPHETQECHQTIRSETLNNIRLN